MAAPSSWPPKAGPGRWGWRAPASAASPLPAACRPDFIRRLVVTQNSQLASREWETCREPSLRGLWRERRRRRGSRSKDQDRRGDPGQCGPEAGRGGGESGSQSDPLVPTFPLPQGWHSSWIFRAEESHLLLSLGSEKGPDPHP